MSLPEISRRCLSCGAAVRGGSRFCHQCGKALEAGAAEVVRPEAPPTGEWAPRPEEAPRTKDWSPPEEEEVPPFVEAPPTKEFAAFEQALKGGEARPGAGEPGAGHVPAGLEAEPAAADGPEPDGAGGPLPAPEGAPGDAAAGEPRGRVARVREGTRARVEETRARVGRMRDEAIVVLEEAPDDPGLRFVLAAAALFVVFLVLLFLSTTLLR